MGWYAGRGDTTPGDGLVCRAGGYDALCHDHAVFLRPDADVIHLLAAGVAAPAFRQQQGVIVVCVEPDAGSLREVSVAAVVGGGK